MSGSPKYNYAVSNAEREQREQREREERERRRREKERLKQEQALESARRNARTTVEALRRRCRELTRSAAAIGRSAELDQVVATIDRAAAGVAAAAEAGAVKAVIKQLGQVERSILVLRDQFSAQHHAVVSERVDELVSILDDLEPADRTRFDAVVAAQVDAMVQAVRQAAQADPAGASARADELAVRVSAHADTVVSRRAEYAAKTASAQEAVAELTERFEALQADAFVAQLQLHGGEEARPTVEAIGAALAQDRIDEVIAIAAILRPELDAVEAALDRAIDEQSARRQLLQSIIVALPELGYDVDPDSLVETTDGAAVLMANNGRGEDLGVFVRTEEGVVRVEYTSSGMLDETATGVDTESCDPLVDLIGHLQARAAAEGFDSTPVAWDSHPDPAGRPPRKWAVGRGHQQGTAGA